MAMGRPKAELVLNADEQAQLQSIARSRSLPAALMRRASIILACATGATNTAVARRFGTTNATVGKWRRRLVTRRIEACMTSCARASRARPGARADQRGRRALPTACPGLGS